MVSSWTRGGEGALVWWPKLMEVVGHQIKYWKIEAVTQLSKAFVTHSKHTIWLSKYLLLDLVGYGSLQFENFKTELEHKESKLSKIPSFLYSTAINHSVH